MSDGPTDAVDADLVISGATLITMDAERRVIEDGAIAIAGERIVAVGKREALARTVRARETSMRAASSPRLASSMRTSTSPAIR